METKQYNFKLFKYSVLCITYGEGMGWFRLFGVGLSWKDFSKYGYTFSQRLGKTKYFKLGKWIISYLPKS